MAFVKGAWVHLLQHPVRLEDHFRLAYQDGRMIPKAQFRRAVERFERATRCLKCVHAAGPKERASILFEYRSAKRDLLDLGALLITDALPMKSLGPDKLSSQSGRKRTLRFSPAHAMSYDNKPKSPEAAK